MADHGTVEYVTAAGNDYPAHEGTYERFVSLTFISIMFVINVLFGLAVGGVMGHWLVSIPVFLLAAVGLTQGLATGSKTSSTVTFVLCFLIFAFNGISAG